MGSSMKAHRVVITGMGIISCAGNEIESFASTILKGERSLFLINDFRINHFNAKYAGLVTDDLLLNPYLDKKEFGTADRAVKLAAIAACQAVTDASIKELLPTIKAGLVLGTCSGPMQTIEGQYQRELDGDASFSEDDYFRRQYYSLSVLLGLHFGITGPAFTVTTACSAFAAAVAAAVDMIRLGMLDCALVGGADSFSTTTLAGFAGLKATHENFCSPFSLTPGLNLGEGAGFVVLENREFALKRSANVKGEILGVGLSNDAWHCSAPDPTGKGAAQSMQNAINNSAVTLSDISFISAHGTGTAANDKAETKAVMRVFGQASASIPMSSTKGALGHCLGAAGAVETIAALVCAEKEIYPPSAGFTEPREGCTLDYVPDTGRVWKKETVFLKNNFAFGGNNASIVIGTGSKTYRQPAEISDDPVCITGTGFVSALGVGASIPDPNTFSQKLDCNEKEISGRGMFSCREVPLFDLHSIDKRLDSRSERSAQMTAIAVVKALASAAIPERQAGRMNLGLFMSIAQGSTWAEQEHIVSLLAHNYELSHVSAFPYIVPNSVTGTVCRMLSLTGHNSTFCNGHGAGLTGLGMAWAAVRNGHASMLLSGSMDDLSERGLVDCVLSETRSVSMPPIGEGAAMFLLEKYSHALERGCVPLCFIRSFVFSFSNGLKNVENYIKMLENGLFEASIKKEQVAVVCYNTWSSEADKAIKAVLGIEGYRVVDCSSLTGNAPASLPLFNISAGLNTSAFEFDSEKKYILSFFNAQQASDCVAVFERVS
jgi:3-oxoacyl-[acyl-carrier-protein] synthase II